MIQCQQKWRYKNSAVNFETPSSDNCTHLSNLPRSEGPLSLTRVFLNLVYRSATLMHCTIRMRCVFGAQSINFPRTRGEQSTPGAWKGHPAHPVLFVFVQKTYKFWFTVNIMQTVLGRRSAGSQYHPHILAFWFANHLRVVCEPFGTLVYIRL